MEEFSQAVCTGEGRLGWLSGGRAGAVRYLGACVGCSAIPEYQPG